MIFQAMRPAPASLPPFERGPAVRLDALPRHHAAVFPPREAAQARLARATVLVVDDEPANVRLLTRILERSGCTAVLATTDAAEAVRLYRQHRPELMLLDLHMPGMDGFEVLEAVQEHRAERSSHPVLVLTGDQGPEVREGALLRGANEFVSKPFELSEVLLRIDNMLETCFLNRELRDQNRILEQAVAARTAALELDIARREQVERQLRTSEARYRHLVENASDLILQTGPDGTIRYVNEAAVRLTGCSAAELEGTPFLALVRPDAVRDVRRFYVRQLRRRQPSSYREFPIVTLHGAERWLGQNVRLSFDGSRVVAAQVIARDVTERRQVERLKDEFLAVASHELRTPLTSVRAALGLLESGMMEQQPERARHTLRIAARNADRLARLVNDILDVERLSSGQAKVDRRAHDIGEVMAQAAETVRPAAEGANVMLVVTPAQAEATLDADRVCQVLVNLLSNAVKFSPPEGTVWLTARVDDDTVQFTVRDRGRGIPAEMRQEVFERFTQVDASDARDKGGTGLGLAISRTIVEQHQGEIWVDRDTTVGTTIHVRLPRSPRRDDAGRPR